MYILDKKKLQLSLKNKGYQSFSQLTKKLGLHRNTLSYFLSGKPVFSSSVQKVFDALGVKPQDVIVEEMGIDNQNAESELANFIDIMSSKFPGHTWIFFGSRARGTNRINSDIDVGVFCKAGINQDTLLNMLVAKEEFEESSTYTINLTNLNDADEWFLCHIMTDARFVGGLRRGWLDFLKMNHDKTKYEKPKAS